MARPDLFKVDPNQSQIATVEQADAWQAKMLKKYGHLPGYPEAIRAQHKFYRNRITSSQRSPLNQAIGFYKSEAAALGRVIKDAAVGTYDLITKPIPTIRNAGHAIAGTIDTIIAAEDTPAYVQIGRAANWVANASPEDLGDAAGKGFGNAFLLVAPEAIGAKLSTVSRLGALDPAAIPRGPPRITWVDEVTTFTGPDRVRAKAFNDSAKGARSNPVTKKGQAPALERTMPNGAKRKVKFDGVDHDSIYGDVMIDRKWSIRSSEKFKNQAIRQSEVLTQHHLIGIWELPTRTKAARASRFLRKMGISNIKVRIAKP